MNDYYERPALFRIRKENVGVGVRDYFYDFDSEKHEVIWTYPNDCHKFTFLGTAELIVNKILEYEPDAELVIVHA